jgi:hypothetical protein
MDELTPEEVVALQEVKRDGDNIYIRPFLVSTAITGHNSLGISLCPVSQADAILPPDYVESLLLKDHVDSSAWYEARNFGNCGLLMKIKYNQLVWEQPAFIPGTTISLCQCLTSLIIAIYECQLLFIDAEYGVPCHPPYFIHGYSKYLAVFENYAICMTVHNLLYVWRFIPGGAFKCVFKTKYVGKLGKLQKIQLTHELTDGSISPILVTEEKTVRYSQSKNAWVYICDAIPAIFMKSYTFQTVADVEKAFSEALLARNSQLFHETFGLLITYYSRLESKSRLITLFTELWAHVKQESRAICGIDVTELMEMAKGVVVENAPELIMLIEEIPNSDLSLSLDLIGDRADDDVEPPDDGTVPESSEAVDTEESSLREEEIDDEESAPGTWESTGNFVEIRRNPTRQLLHLTQKVKADTAEPTFSRKRSSPLQRDRKSVV